MRPALLLICLLAFNVISYAQTTVSGSVKSSKGQPISGASVSIKDSYDGGTSDSLGNYKFETSEKGEKLLVTSSIGYKVTEQKINLVDGEVQANITLREEPNELKAVVITAGSFEASECKGGGGHFNLFFPPIQRVDRLVDDTRAVVIT